MRVCCVGFPPLQGALETFLRAPEGYLGQALPKPLPARGVPRDPASLGAEQYVEETLAALVNGSMLELSQRRTTLQHPGLGARKAALRFIAHYLKSHNPRNSAQIAAHERARLDEFVASATLAAGYCEGCRQGVAARFRPMGAAETAQQWVDVHQEAYEHGDRVAGQADDDGVADPAEH